MSETLPGLIKYSLDTKENWELVNPILPKDIFCFETSINGIKLKIGNGSNTWSDIPYFENQTPVLSELSTLGVVSRAVLADLDIGLNEFKYITPSILLSHLQKKFSGDTIILTPGTHVYRSVAPETYIYVFDYPPLRPYGSAEPEQGGLIPDVAFRMEHKGSATISLQSRKGVRNTQIRICKNLTELQSWVISWSNYRTQTHNVDFIPGDIIAVQAKKLSGSSDGRIRNIQILVNQII